MSSPRPVVRFDDALTAAIGFLDRELAGRASAAVIVRDVTGRIRAALDDRSDADLGRMGSSAEFEARFRDAVGGFAAGSEDAVLLASQMVSPDQFFGSPDLQQPVPGRKVRVLERLLTAADWTRCCEPSTATDPSGGHPPRIAFFGIKGGVGRSTALAALAWHLAHARKKRVLVVDLDLESPGLGALVLPADECPDYGVVDWLVESLASQADEHLEREMVRRSPLGRTAEGEVLVVPAGGRFRETYRYLPKLARAYADTYEDDGLVVDFAERLLRMVSSIERANSVDVTLFDSRAGLHDLAAAAVTRLDADPLLFAVESSQTWDAYRLLFHAWREAFWRIASPCGRNLRERLRMVAALVPETNTQEYLGSFLLHSHSLFADFVYEETPPGAEGDVFNFDISDVSAPHHPLRINWSQAMQQFDPVGRPEALIPEQIAAAFGEFFRGVDEWLED